MEEKKEHQQEEELEEFLTLLGERYAKQQKKKIDQLKEVEMPESLDEWFEEFCDKKFGKEEFGKEEEMAISREDLEVVAGGKPADASHRKKRGAIVFLKRVAVIAIILLGIGVVGATVNAEAFHFDLWKIFNRDEGTNMLINNADLVEENFHLSSDWYGFYYPSYIPEGYELVSEKVEKKKGKLVFENDERELVFCIVRNNSVLVLDKENGEYQQDTIGDKELYYTINEKESVVTAYIESYAISVCYNGLSDSEIEKILKNFKLFSN